MPTHPDQGQMVRMIRVNLYFEEMRMLYSLINDLKEVEPRITQSDVIRRAIRHMYGAPPEVGPSRAMPIPPETDQGDEAWIADIQKLRELDMPESQIYEALTTAKPVIEHERIVRLMKANQNGES